MVAHCVIQDQEGFSGQASLLALKRMKQNHTAKDIATVLISVILDYEIALTTMNLKEVVSEQVLPRVVYLKRKRVLRRCTILWTSESFKTASYDGASKTTYLSTRLTLLPLGD